MRLAAVSPNRIHIFLKKRIRSRYNPKSLDDLAHQTIWHIPSSLIVDAISAMA